MQYHEEKSRDIAQKKLRQKELQIDKQSSNRRKNYQQNLQIFDKIFEIADVTPIFSIPNHNSSASNTSKTMMPRK